MGNSNDTIATLKVVAKAVCDKNMSKDIKDGIEQARKKVGDVDFDAKINNDEVKNGIKEISEILSNDKFKSVNFNAEFTNLLKMLNSVEHSADDCVNSINNIIEKTKAIQKIQDIGINFKVLGYDQQQKVIEKYYKLQDSFDENKKEKADRINKVKDSASINRRESSMLKDDNVNKKYNELLANDEKRKEIEKSVIGYSEKATEADKKTINKYYELISLLNALNSKKIDTNLSELEQAKQYVQLGQDRVNVRNKISDIEKEIEKKYTIKQSKAPKMLDITRKQSSDNAKAEAIIEKYYAQKEKKDTEDFEQFARKTFINATNSVEKQGNTVKDKYEKQNEKNEKSKQAGNSENVGNTVGNNDNSGIVNSTNAFEKYKMSINDCKKALEEFYKKNVTNKKELSIDEIKKAISYFEQYEETIMKTKGEMNNLDKDSSEYEKLNKKIEEYNKYKNFVKSYTDEGFSQKYNKEAITSFNKDKGAYFNQMDSQDIVNKLKNLDELSYDLNGEDLKKIEEKISTYYSVLKNVKEQTNLLGEDKEYIEGRVEDINKNNPIAKDNYRKIERNKEKIKSLKMTQKTDGTSDNAKQSDNGNNGNIGGESVEATVIKVDAEQAIKNIKEVKEKLDTIPEQKNIKINVSDNMDEVQNRLNDGFSKIQSVETQNKIQEELKETQNAAKQTNETLSNTQTDKTNISSVFYRGVNLRGTRGESYGEEGAYSKGSVSETPWWSSSLKVAKEYAGELGEIYSAQLNLQKIMTVDANGSHWNNILYLGNGENDNSKKAISLYSELTKYRDILKNDYNWDESVKGFREIYTNGDNKSKASAMNYQKAKFNFDNFLRSSDNYGYTSTDDIAKLAKEMNYQALIIKNVMDSENGIIADNMSLLTNTKDGLENLTIQKSKNAEIVKPIEINTTTPSIKEETKSLSQEVNKEVNNVNDKAKSSPITDESIDKINKKLEETVTLLKTISDNISFKEITTAIENIDLSNLNTMNETVRETLNRLEEVLNVLKEIKEIKVNPISDEVKKSDTNIKSEVENIEKANEEVKTKYSGKQKVSVRTTTKPKENAVTKAINEMVAQSDEYNKKFESKKDELEKVTRGTRYLRYNHTSKLEQAYKDANERLNNKGEDYYSDVYNRVARKLPKSKSGIQQYVKDTLSKDNFSAYSQESIDLLTTMANFRNEDNYFDNTSYKKFDVLKSKTSKEKILELGNYTNKWFGDLQNEIKKIDTYRDDLTKEIEQLSNNLASPDFNKSIKYDVKSNFTEDYSDFYNESDKFPKGDFFKYYFNRKGYLDSKDAEIIKNKNIKNKEDIDTSIKSLEQKKSQLTKDKDNAYEKYMISSRKNDEESNKEFAEWRKVEEELQKVCDELKAYQALKEKVDKVDTEQTATNNKKNGIYYSSTLLSKNSSNLSLKNAPKLKSEKIKDTTSTVKDNIEKEQKNQSVKQPENNKKDYGLNIGNIEKESESVKGLKKDIENVSTSVDEKTTAFTNEKIAVETAVQHEISQLEKLENKLKEIKSYVSNLFDGFNSENISEIEEKLSSIKVHPDLSEWANEINTAISKLELKSIDLKATVNSEDIKKEIENSTSSNKQENKTDNNNKSDNTKGKRNNNQNKNQNSSTTDYSSKVKEEMEKVEKKINDSGEVISNVSKFYDSHNRLKEARITSKTDYENGNKKETQWNVHYDPKEAKTYTSHFDRMLFADDTQKSINESYSRTMKWLKEIYALKEKISRNDELNRKDADNNDYYRKQIDGLKTLIKEEENFRKRNSLISDSKDKTYVDKEKQLKTEYENRRKSFENSKQQMINTAFDSATEENQKRINTEQYERVNALLKERTQHYENIQKAKLNIERLKTNNSSQEEISNLERIKQGYTDSYNAVRQELSVYGNLVDEENQFQNELQITKQYQEDISKEIEKRNRIEKDSAVSGYKNSLKDYYSVQIKEANDKNVSDVQRLSSNNAYDKIVEYESKINQLKDEGILKEKEYDDLLNMRKAYESDLSKALLENQKSFTTDGLNVNLETAYRKLGSTEKKYNTYQFKADTGTATKTQLESLQRLKAERQAYSEVVSKSVEQGIELTNSERIAQEKYNQSVEEGKQLYNSLVSDYDKTYRVSNIEDAYSQAKVINSGLNKTRNDMSKLSEKAPNGLSPAIYDAQIKINKLNSEFINGTKTANEYKNAVSGIINPLKNVFAVVEPSNIEQASQAMSRYIQETSKGRAKFKGANVNGNTYSVSATYSDDNKRAHEIVVSTDLITGQVSKMSDTVGKKTTFLSGVLDGMKGKLQDVVRYFASFVTVYDAWNALQRGITVVKELDTAFTEMRKVSDESVESLKKYQEASYGIASAAGTDALQIQNSTADFLRLGESLDEASKSAEEANILFNVSEFQDINEATDSLIAMSQAYKDMDKGHIVDVLNNIGNNFSISTEGLAQGLQRSAGVLSVAGNDLYEAAALITAGNLALPEYVEIHIEEYI